MKRTHHMMPHKQALSCRRLWLVQAGIEDTSGFIMFPLVVHTMDLVVSAVGILSVGSKSSAKPNQAIEDPYDVIKVGVKPTFRLNPCG